MERRHFLNRLGHGGKPPIRHSSDRSSQVKDGDVMIPVFGLRGSGRSSFINCLLQGREEFRRPKIGRAFEQSPVTQTCEPFVLREGAFYRNIDYKRLPGRIVLLDTPPLDGDFLGEDEVLQEVGRYIQGLCAGRSVWIGGVIFMVYGVGRGQEPRVARRAAEIVGRFHQENPSPCFALVSSGQWAEYSDSRLEQHHQVLLEERYSRLMSPDAPRDVAIFRFTEEIASAWGAIDGIVHRFVMTPEAERNEYRARSVKATDWIHQSRIFTAPNRFRALPPAPAPFTNSSRVIWKGPDVCYDIESNGLDLPIRRGGGVFHAIDPALRKRLEGLTSTPDRTFQAVAEAPRAGSFEVILKKTLTGNMAWDDIEKEFTQSEFWRRQGDPEATHSDFLAHDSNLAPRLTTFWKPRRVILEKQVEESARFVPKAKLWFKVFMTDPDIVNCLELDMDKVWAAIADVVGTSGEPLGRERDSHGVSEKSFLESGIARSLDFDMPHVKVFRLKLTVWSQISKKLILRTGIRGDLRSSKFCLRDEYMDSIKDAME